MKVPRTVSVRAFRWFALADFVAMIVIVLTGAAVRLTGSGLGCPDWPTCYQHRLSGSWSLHPLVEYANRMVTVSLVCVTIATAVAAWRRTPRRRDLTIFSLALVGGVFADAILGAFVVYTKLNPWLVCVHMLLSLGMVILGAVLYHRSKYLYGEGTRADVRAPRVQLVARVLWIPYVILLCAGTITTGSGPHAGSSAGQLRAKRLPFAFDYAVLVHAIVATVFLVLLLLVLRWVTSVGFSDRLTGGVKRLLTIAMVQMGIGVSQYFLHVPALLVELHVAGAVSLTIGMTQFHLRQAAREKDPVFLTSK